MDTPHKIRSLLTYCFCRNCCIFQTLATVKSNINLATKWRLFGRIFTRSDLKRSLAVYRLAFGQPRQEDLVAFLANNKSMDGADVSIASQLDLSPPRING